MKIFKTFKHCIPGIICAVLPLWLYAAEKSFITMIDVTTSKAKTILVFEFNNKAEPSSIIQLKDPYRLIIELTDKNIYYDQPSISVKQGLVDIIRFELKDSVVRTKEIEYIAIELNDSFVYDTTLKGKKWNIVFKPKTDDMIKEKPIKQIQGKLDLDQALKIAYANNAQAQLVREKIKLARLRRFEALRALFPAMTAKYEQTKGESRGEAGNLTLFGFKERFLTLQLSQPLYQGGRLKATYDQASVNLEINILQYDKIIQDLDHEARKAYMNVMQQQENLSLYKELVAELKQDFNMTKKLSRQKLNTRVEFLNVKSKYKQALYQVASIKKDLALTKAQLLQVLNLDEQMLGDVEPVTAYSELDLSLEKLLRQMRLNRPDLHITELELKLGELGKKIGHSEKGLKVEISGSVGRSASHYDTEELDWKNDFSGGIKLSKPFGGNTVGSSFLHDDTSAKLGQSTRTRSQTGSVYISLLDNIKSLSDAMESDILLMEATQKLIEAKRTAAIDVKENFYNYQKSVIQKQGLDEEIELNEREVTITKQKKELNLAQMSELVDSKIKLAGTHMSLNEVIVYYHISLSGINKSIGLVNFYKP